MNLGDALTVTLTALLSLGGGGAIVVALSGYLGKLWAQRLMASETARHAQELEELRSQLARQVEKDSQNYKHKIELYKEVAHPLIELVVKGTHSGQLTPEDLRAFDETRLKTTALLAMFAPATVFDQYNGMIDYIYNAVEGKVPWSFAEFRTIALNFLSAVRTDIGLYNDVVTYTGSR